MYTWFLQFHFVIRGRQNKESKSVKILALVNLKLEIFGNLPLKLINLVPKKVLKTA